MTYESASLNKSRLTTRGRKDKRKTEKDITGDFNCRLQLNHVTKTGRKNFCIGVAKVFFVNR